MKPNLTTEFVVHSESQILYYDSAILLSDDRRRSNKPHHNAELYVFWNPESAHDSVLLKNRVNFEITLKTTIKLAEKVIMTCPLIFQHFSLTLNIFEKIRCVV